MCGEGKKNKKNDDVIRERSTKSLKYVGYINAVILTVSVKNLSPQNDIKFIYQT